MNNLTLSFTDDNFAIIAFNQPDRKVNVLTRSLWTDFKAALESIQNQKLDGLIVKSDKPGCFLAGADLKELYPATLADRPRYESFIDLGSETLNLLAELSIPTFALVDGVCLGGGLEVALACDAIMFMNSDRLKVGFPEINLGLIPGWGGTQRLPRHAGMELAKNWICTGIAATGSQVSFGRRCIDTERHAIQSIKAWCAEDESLYVLRLIKELAVSRVEEETILTDPPDDPKRLPAFQAAMRLIEATESKSLADGLKLEREAFLDLIPSPEAQELMGEFFNRKK